MATLTKMTAADRERARAKAVEILERAARTCLALGLADNPRGQELASRINADRLVPRVEVRLSGNLPIVIAWADDESGAEVPLWLFSVSDRDHPSQDSPSSPPPASRLN